MQKPNEVLTHSQLLDLIPLSKFPYISAAVLSKPEISKSLEENCTTTGAPSQLRQPVPVWDENTLIAIAEQQSRGLAETLDRLKVYNERIVYQIASTFEPYLETDQNLYVQMPPKSSRKVMLNVTRRGKAEPSI